MSPKSDGGVRVIRHLLKSLRNSKTRSWRVRTHLERRRVERVGHTHFRMTCAIHATPLLRGLNVEVKSSITLWPASRRRLPAGWKRAGWNADLLKARWYQACQRELKRLGYDGKWQASPWGRFGDFWKDLDTPSAIAAEIKLLARLSEGAWLPKLSNKWA